MVRVRVGGLPPKGRQLQIDDGFDVVSLRTQEKGGVVVRGIVGPQSRFPVALDCRPCRGAVIPLGSCTEPSTSAELSTFDDDKGVQSGVDQVSSVLEAQ